MAIRRSKFHASVSMSSTADIAFLLLIFFMVTSVLKVDADIPLILPEAKGSKLKDKEVMLSISKYNQIFYNNIPLTAQEAIARVRAELQTKPDLQVNLQAHKDLNFEKVETLLDMLKEAGVVKFAMVTKTEKQ